MHRNSTQPLRSGRVWLLLTASANAQDPDLTILTKDPNGFLRGGALMGISGNGRCVAFWSINPLVPGVDPELRLWLIEEPAGTSLFDAQTGGRSVAMSSDGLDIMLSKGRGLDARDTNGFRDVYHFEMPPNPASLAFEFNCEFNWASHNDFVPANSVFLDQLGIGGNGVAGFQASANSPPP